MKDQTVLLFCKNSYYRLTLKDMSVFNRRIQIPFLLALLPWQNHSLFDAEANACLRGSQESNCRRTSLQFTGLQGTCTKLKRWSLANMFLYRPDNWFPGRHMKDSTSEGTIFDSRDTGNFLNIEFKEELLVVWLLYSMSHVHCSPKATIQICTSTIHCNGLPKKEIAHCSKNP